MKDLFKTFCWTMVVVSVILLLIGIVYVIGLIVETCPTPSPIVKNIFCGFPGFMALFLIVHAIRHPKDPLDGLFDNNDSSDDTKVYEAEFKECDSCASKP